MILLFPIITFLLIIDSNALLEPPCINYGLTFREIESANWQFTPQYHNSSNWMTFNKTFFPAWGDCGFSCFGLKLFSTGYAVKIPVNNTPFHDSLNI